MGSINWDSPCVPRVFAWLRALPSDPTGFVDADFPPHVGLHLYRDYLSWMHAYVSDILENYELEYRRVGLAYHLMPLSFRNSLPQNQTILNGSATTPRIHPGVFEYLKTLFNFSGGRTQEHRFFKYWLKAEDRLLEMKFLVGVNSESVVHMRSVSDAYDEKYDSVRTLVTYVRKVLTETAKGVEILSRVQQDQDGAGVESDLASWLNEEGRAYRRWVSSFPEVVSGLVTQAEADEVLRVMGPEASMERWNRYKKLEKNKEEKAEA